MKALVIISVLLVLLIGFSAWFGAYMQNVTAELVQELEAVAQAEDPLAPLQDFYEHWEKESALLEITIDHEEIDLINSYLWSMETQAELGQREDFLVSLSLVKNMLEHIAEKNSLQLNNIF